MSHRRNSSRLVVVALVLAGSAIAACADGLPTALRPAPHVAADGDSAADSTHADSARADSLGADSLGADSARVDSLHADSARVDSLHADSATADSPADSLAFPEACAYLPDSARLDSAGVDSVALGASRSCRDSLALQLPFDYPAGDAVALPPHVALVGPITGTDPDPFAATDSVESPCLRADTAGPVGPASFVVCLHLRNTDSASARVTLPAGLVVVARSRDVQNGVAVTPIDVDVPAGSTRSVAVALYATSGWRNVGVAADVFRLGPVSSHPVVRQLVDAVGAPGSPLAEPSSVQLLVWFLAQHGNDEMTGELLETLHAGALREGALRAGLARGGARAGRRTTRR